MLIIVLFSISLVIWALIMETNPIRFLLQYVFLILNVAYLLAGADSDAGNQSDWQLSFYSLLIIIIYGSALSILFGIIVMVYRPNQEVGDMVPYGCGYMTTKDWRSAELVKEPSSKSKSKSNRLSLWVEKVLLYSDNYKGLVMMILTYALIKLSIWIQVEELTYTFISTDEMKALATNSSSTLLTTLYHQLYNMTLISNVWNVLIVVVILLVTMLFLVLSLI